MNGRARALRGGRRRSALDGVIVDYAHTPAGVEAVLRLGPPAGRWGRVLVVVGAGGDRDLASGRSWAPAARGRGRPGLRDERQPALRGPRLVIVAEVARRPRASRAGLSWRPPPTGGWAIGRALARDAQAGDVVVIAGKGHEQGQEIAGVKSTRSTTAPWPAPLPGRGGMIPAPRAGEVEGVVPAVGNGVPHDPRPRERVGRTAGPGALFVAIRGGHEFVGAERDRGAATLVPGRRVRRDRGARPGPRAAGAVARFVGIAGSTGKTSTKDVLARSARPTRRRLDQGTTTRSSASLDARADRAGDGALRRRAGMRGPARSPSSLRSSGRPSA